MKVELTYLSLFLITYFRYHSTTCPPGRFGTDCHLICRCQNTTRCPDQCVECMPGYSEPTLCQRENIALSKSVMASGTARCDDVVNGNISNNVAHCTSTVNTNSSKTWLSVDLEHHYRVKWITLYVTKGHNHKGLSIRLSREEPTSLAQVEYVTSSIDCWENEQSSLDVDVFHIECSDVNDAQYVVLLKNGEMFLAEIEVYHCSPYTFGERCDKQCNCYYSSDVCDHVTGVCEGGCAAGYTGIDCSTPCPPYKFGVNCAYNCNCRRGHSCDPIQGTCQDGKCDVRHIEHNQRCQKTCPNFTHGYPKCNGICRCHNNHECDVWTGLCYDGKCEEFRWTGSYCNKTCLNGKYLINGKCDGTCGCANNVYCDVDDGVCIKGGCPKYYIGIRCETHCPSHSWGEHCDLKCYCVKNERCSDDGFCRRGCHGNWGGRSCNRTCTRGKYLIRDKCTGVCHCNLCSFINGSCQGPCHVGFIGPNCQTPCPPDNYGALCKYVCHCATGGICHKSTGKCSLGCADGWKGERCQKCENQRFGIDCHGICHCENNASCNHDNGVCPGQCAKNWYGHSCQEFRIRVIRKLDMEQVIALAVAGGSIIIFLIAVFIFFNTRKMIGRSGSSDESLTTRKGRLLSIDFDTRGLEARRKSMKRPSKQQDQRASLDAEKGVPNKRALGNWKKVAIGKTIDSDDMNVRGDYWKNIIGKTVNHGDASGGDFSTQDDHGDGGDREELSDDTSFYHNQPLNIPISIDEERSWISQETVVGDAAGDIEDELLQKAVAKLPPINKPRLRDLVVKYSQPGYEEPMVFGNMALDDELRSLFDNPKLCLHEADVDFTEGGYVEDLDGNKGRRHNGKHVSLGPICKIPARVKGISIIDVTEDNESVYAERETRVKAPKLTQKVPIENRKMDIPHRKKRSTSKSKSKSDIKVPTLITRKFADKYSNSKSVDKFEDMVDYSIKIPPDGTVTGDYLTVPLLNLPMSDKASSGSGASDRSNVLDMSDRGYRCTRSHYLTHPDQKDTDDPSLVKNWSSISQNSFLKGWES